MKFIFFLWTLLKIVLNLKSASLCLNNEHCHRLKVTLTANLYLCSSSRHRLKTSTQLLQWFKIGFERETHLTWLLWLYEVKVANCKYGQWTLMFFPFNSSCNINLLPFARHKIISPRTFFNGVTSGFLSAHLSAATVCLQNFAQWCTFLEKFRTQRPKSFLKMQLHVKGQKFKGCTHHMVATEFL